MREAGRKNLTSNIPGLQDRAWQQLAVQRSLLEPHLAAAEAAVKDLRAEAAAGCKFVTLQEKVCCTICDVSA